MLWNNVQNYGGVRVTQCNLLDKYQRVGETCCLRVQGGTLHAVTPKNTVILPHNIVGT
jgi:hypothetical protein